MAVRLALNRSLEQWLKRLEGQLDIDPLIQGCCEALLKMSQADRCSIMILEGQTEELTVRWAQGIRVRPYGRLKFRVGEGLCGWVARSQKPLFSLDMSRERRFLPAQSSGIPGRSRRSFRPVKALFCLPLVAEGQTVGVVNLSSFSSRQRLHWMENRIAKRFLDRLARVIAHSVLLREAEESASRWRRLLKVTSEMVAQVSHEVRTPLTLIQEGAQQLLDGLGGPLNAKQQGLLGVVRAQADRMMKLVAELLDLSRVETGRFPLQREPIDLAEMIQELRSRYQPLLSSRRLTLLLDPIPAVYGDRSRLTQVFENLLVNAVKFTPEGGSIHLKLSARGRSAEWSITDNGVGIPKRDQRRLFEKFFQPRIPATLAARGTGLGLAIVKEIVQLHGGTIRVASEPGKGTTFTVSLPLFTPSFALTEEFRVMRQQAAREGQILGVQLFQEEPGASVAAAIGSRTTTASSGVAAAGGSRTSSASSGVAWQAVCEILKKHVSREDRLLVNPAGGVAVLSISDPDGFQSMRKRLKGVFSAHPTLAACLDRIRWGWALVPQEETELPAVLKLAQRRAQGNPQKVLSAV